MSISKKRNSAAKNGKHFFEGKDFLLPATFLIQIAANNVRLIAVEIQKTFPMIRFASSRITSSSSTLFLQTSLAKKYLFNHVASQRWTPFHSIRSYHKTHTEPALPQQKRSRLSSLHNLHQSTGCLSRYHRIYTSQNRLLMAISFPIVLWRYPLEQRNTALTLSEATPVLTLTVSTFMKWIDKDKCSTAIPELSLRSRTPKPWPMSSTISQKWLKKPWIVISNRFKKVSLPSPRLWSILLIANK